MERRDFIRLSLAASSAMFLPTFGQSARFNIGEIDFSSATFGSNAAQTIIIFLYGGASQLSGNVTNLTEIERYSQNSYAGYFRGNAAITHTDNGCWQEAGGSHMEELVAAGDMTLYRACYSQEREDAGNKAHGVCTEQNQKGSFDTDCGGIVANIATILHAKGVLDANTLMPFVTMEGESTFYEEGNIPLPGYLKPVGINENFDNPYDRDVRRWLFCTDAERENNNCTDSDSNYIPKLSRDMDSISQSHNEAGKIKDAFDRRGSLSSFINSVKDASTPELGDNAYPDNDFSDKIEAAIKLLDKNPDTKILTLGTGGLGGWDDHNEARDYVRRMENLFHSLKSAMAHLRVIEKDDTINIMVFGEFGRNVNLNSANGWDHGNLQNLYVLGGKRYFTHKGVVGETVVDNAGSNRIWLKPKSGTYQFEPLSIAATLYRIYGIENPNKLTGGNYPPVNLLS
jgi:hypothetical protein